MTKLAILAPLMVFACCGNDPAKLATPCTCPIDRWDIGGGMFTYYAEEFDGECEFLRDSFFDDGDIPFGYCADSSTTPDCKDGVSGFRNAAAGNAAIAGNRTKKLHAQKPLPPGNVKPHTDMTPPPLPGATLLKTWHVTLQTDEAHLIPARLFLLLVPSSDAANPARIVGIGREVKPGGTPDFTVAEKYVTTLEPPTPNGNYWEYDARLGSTVFHVLTTEKAPADPAKVLDIDSLDPAMVQVGYAGMLTVNGSNLGAPGFVTIAGTRATVMSWTATQIKVNVVAAMTVRPGRKRVVVHNSVGDLGETSWKVEP